jgi:hypothetical protein
MRSSACARRPLAIGKASGSLFPIQVEIRFRRHRFTRMAKSTLALQGAILELVPIVDEAAAPCRSRWNRQPHENRQQLFTAFWGGLPRPSRT